MNEGNVEKTKLKGNYYISDGRLQIKNRREGRKEQEKESIRKKEIATRSEEGIAFLPLLSDQCCYFPSQFSCSSALLL